MTTMRRFLRVLGLVVRDQRGDVVPDDILTTVKAAIKGEVKPLADRLDAIESELRTPDPEVVRRDATGRLFQFATSGERVEVKAPAHVSAVGGDSKPLSLVNIWRGVNLGKANPGAFQTIAREELAMSERLKQAGYGSMGEMYMGSVLFPLAAELIMAPIDEKGQPAGDVTALRKEIGERLRLTVDPGEVGWMMKRAPDFARDVFGLQRRDLQVGDDTLGGYLITPTYSDNLIDLLRNALTIMRAGAREVPLPPTGNITHRRLNADPAASYGDPDTTSDASSTTISLGVVRLIAKAIRAWITMPNDLLRYSSPSVEMIARMALAASFAVTEDNKFLEGAGSTLEPKGIINYPASSAEVPATGKLTLHVAGGVGTDGNTFKPEDVANILALYSMGKDPDPATAWIMRPLLWANIFNKRADVLTTGDGLGPFLFWISRGEAAKQLPDVLGDAPVIKSTNASNNRSKGSGTTLGYTLYGNFKRALIGRVGVLELAVSEHVKFFQDKTVIRGVGRNDLGLEHEESFVFTDTLLNS